MSGSVSLVSETSLVSDFVLTTLVISGPEWTKIDSTSCVGFNSVSIVSNCKTVDVSGSSRLLIFLTLTFLFLSFATDLVCIQEVDLTLYVTILVI